MAIELLVLEVDSLRLGIHSCEVCEVLRAVALAPLARSPSVMEGALNLRGEIIAVLDIRAILQLPAKPIEPAEHLIVLAVGERRLAIRADRAIGLALVDESVVSPADETPANTEYTGAIVKTSAGVVHLLDLKNLLSPSDSAWLARTLPTAAPMKPASLRRTLAAAAREAAP
jgi:purine-binding chemotaxis protein CheW